MDYKFDGIKEAAAETANWNHSGIYTQTLLDRETLEVWTVTHTQNNWCQIRDRAVTVVISTEHKVSEQRLQELCESEMQQWERIKAAWKEVGCGGEDRYECADCRHFYLCCNR